MSWGTELWDQFENLSVHTLKGIDFLEKYGHFIRDRATIEYEYAYKLRKLVKNYQPKKKDEEEYQYSSCKAFKLLMDEVNDLAGQHEVVAENLQENVIKELTALIKDLRDERKRQLYEGSKLTQALQNQVDELFRSKKAYDKAFKESEKAIENFQKADADFNLSRAEVEKQRLNMSYKSQACDTAKNHYADQLQRTNELQRQHYRSGLPDVFRQLQELDEKRIKNIKNFIYSTVEIEKNVFPIINKCLDGIIKAADLIDEKQDALMVIERFKSGFTPPEDYPFEDLSKSNGSNSGSIQNVNHIQRPKDVGNTVRTISGHKIKKRTGILNIFGSRGNATVADGKEDFSDLAPNQRRKKLIQKVEELQMKVLQETATRDGLMKMKTVYESNPALGDPMSVEGQLNECSHKLERLQMDLRRYQGYLDEGSRGGLQNSNSQNNSPRLVNGSRQHRNSGGSGHDEESLSSCSNSPESGLGTSRTSLPGADSDQDQYDGHHAESENDYYVLPSLGTCKALYAFEATSEGSIPMSENEELHLIELDQGDGWTRVRRINGQCEEGFVPTSYIETTLYNT
ncbi:hypothetical protein FQR65_LT09141 [Abscondita terminalis]|nr:hypothetical protein FQR65_LT09141 [Abscondita terminalis]